MLSIGILLDPRRNAHLKRCIDDGLRAPLAGRVRTFVCDDLPALQALRPEVLVGHQRPEVLDYLAMPDCPTRWFHSMSSGVDVLLAALQSDPRRLSALRISATRGIHSQAMREYVLAMMFYHTKLLLNWQRRQRRHSWYRTRLPLLAGRRVLVIGTGHIGREVARACTRLGLKVEGISRTGKAVTGFSRIRTVRHLPERLEHADYVVLALPLTPETRGLIDADGFARMKPGAIFINISRGELVDEEALRRALESGHLQGASVDTFQTEPLPARSPLWDTPNLLLTPHVAGLFDDGMERGAALFIDNLAAWMESGALLTEVSIEHGY